MLAATLLGSPQPLPDPRSGTCPLAGQPPISPGAGRLEVEQVDGLSSVVTCRAASPLQLLAPRPRAPAAWILAASHGGGLVTGDAIDVRVRVGPGATAYLGTQAETKVYRAALRESLGHGPRSVDGQSPPPPAQGERDTGTRQALEAEIAAGGLLAVLPDPVSPFAGARHAQVQRFALAPGASLALLDAVTAGRAARGERWAFAGYASRNELRTAGALVLADALRLGAAEGPPLERRLAGVELLATVVLVGPRVAAAAAALLRLVDEAPADGAAPVLLAASALQGGCVLRLAARSVEAGMAALRTHLAFLAGPLDGDPLLRRP